MVGERLLDQLDGHADRQVFVLHAGDGGAPDRTHREQENLARVVGQQVVQCLDEVIGDVRKWRRRCAGMVFEIDRYAFRFKR